jgi:ABC-type branched-subunit amino acid transport system ATPase component
MAFLEVCHLQSGYGNLPVLHGVSLRVDAGEVVAIFGPNGAGKSTFAKTLFGFLPPSGGSIIYDGQELEDLPVERRSELGMAYVPQESNTFRALSIEDNIRVGLVGRSDIDKARALRDALDLFPKLAERRAQMASTLSGGERQMLALASAVATRPKLLIVDEPTSGLAPIIVDGLVEQTLEIANAGATILWVVGDDAEKILPRADRCYLMQSGVIGGEWSGSDKLDGDQVAELYFGAKNTAGEGKKP